MKFFLILLLFPFSGYSSSPDVSKQDMKNHLSYPEFDKENPKAKGIILSFKSWPLSNEQKNQVLQKTTPANLNEKLSIERFKIIVFEWQNWREGKQATDLCATFLNLDFLDYCEPDLLQGPAMGIFKKKKKPRKRMETKREPEITNTPTLKPRETFSEEQSGNLKTCEIVPTALGLQKGDLSDYWAQEMIGSDLMKEELKLVPPVKKKLVTLFDTTNKNHDIGARNLISDEGRHAVLPEIGNNITIFNSNYASAYLQEADRLLRTTEQECSSGSGGAVRSAESSIVTGGENAYQKCRATVMPSFINNSMKWGNLSQSTYRAFKSLSPPSVIVTGSANDHPEPLEEMKVKASQDYNMIIVGSLDPNGYRSDFSQEGPAVTIVAPSDHLLTSATSTGQYRRYGGTSGATPLVTGSLAGFEWLAGYHPTAEEAKILLEKTAIPTPYSNDKPLTNGSGMVNAYKLAMVGKQLRQTCGSNITCFKDLIRKNDIYNFPEDTALDDEINRAFPACGTTCTAEDLNSLSANCAKKAQVFKKLRKQAFLNPQNKELWKKIACIYSQADLTKNAEGALTTYRALTSYGTVIKDQYCKTDSDCALVPTCPSVSKGDDIKAPLPMNTSTTTGGSGSFKGDDISDPPSPFITMNKIATELHYIRCIQGTKKLPLCNNKCRCGREETKTETIQQRGIITTHYQTVCESNQCQLRTTESVPPPPPVGGGSAPPIGTPPIGSGGSVK